VNQAARQRAGNEARENAVEGAVRDGDRAENAKDRYDDANSPGNSGNSKGKKGEPPGQEKKSKNNKK
jgi:hypothetical protein